MPSSIRGTPPNWRTEPETEILDEIGRLRVPHVSGARHHDSRRIQEAVAAQPNSIVLDGDAQDVRRSAGVGLRGSSLHPCQVSTRREGRRAGASCVGAPALGADMPPAVDVVLVYDPNLAARVGIWHRWCSPGTPRTTSLVARPFHPPHRGIDRRCKPARSSGRNTRVAHLLRSSTSIPRPNGFACDRITVEGWVRAASTSRGSWSTHPRERPHRPPHRQRCHRPLRRHPPSLPPQHRLFHGRE